ncbi:Putative NADH-flavin reductase [Pedobacter westerhofensis]|uniref:NADH-flavin reductase n=1 Tax=Pedobacter westerhofensis TaxID=425512 RepID=A0A521FSU0_9SPHI|nr:NAD(P)-binding oxidoreductase [Pedobacter westerhofensis]SMO99154.1 Putative NADH-flavin reductase [Pedobacter westerhofensis]
MKHIAIVGATGSTGKELVRLAIEADYKVTVIVRYPSKMKSQNGVSIITGDVTDLVGLVKAFENIDAVISCFGPSDHRKVGTLMSTGTTNIVKACEKNAIKRFIFMSGFVQADYSEMAIVTRLITPIFRMIYHQSYNDKNIAESAIQNSNLDWTIVRAPGLNHSQPTGKYKAGIKTEIYFGLMPFADCAQCLLDAIDEKGWAKQIINVGKK